MPYNAMMQGFSTFFATAMTVTVISFPTPGDLYDTMFPPSENRSAEVVSGGVVPDLPKTDARSPAQLAEELDACRDSLSGVLPISLATCREVLVEAAVQIEANPSGPMTSEIEGKADLVAALYCRTEWVEAMRESDTFDLDQCQGQVLALAD